MATVGPGSDDKWDSVKVDYNQLQELQGDLVEEDP